MRLGDKDSRISIRISHDLDNWLSDRARLSSMNQSDYVRFILEDFRRTVLIAERVASAMASDDKSTSCND